MRSVALLSVEGARSFVVASSDGALRAESGAGASAEDTASVLAVLVGHLDATGEALGLGALTTAALKAGRTSRVLGRQRGLLALVDLEPNHATADVEQALVDTDWTTDLGPRSTDSAAPMELDDADLLIDPGEDGAGQSGAPQAPNTNDAGATSWKLGHTLHGWLATARAKSRAPTTQSASSPPPPPAMPAPPPFGPPRAPMSPRIDVAPVSTPPASLLTGSLKLFALPDLLEFLRTGQRTGTLVCASEAGLGALHLKEGRLTGATSPNVPSLGEWLVRHGALSGQALREAVKAHEQSGAKRQLETTLVEEGFVKSDVVRDALRKQIGETVRELMSWANGEFSFDSKGSVEATASEIDVALDPQAVLLNIFKELDEAQR
jgi:hypothetical protein